MKKVLFIFGFILFWANDSAAQYDDNWAIGVRVGEPLGLNVRKYFAFGDRAFDFNLGTYGFIYGRERPYGHGENKGEYKSAGMMIQGIYLWKWSPGRDNNLHFTYGFGGQINNRDHYLDKLMGQREDKVKKMSLGPTGTAGVEYKLPNNDLGIFLDGGAYMEVLPVPFFWNWQVSGGVRLNIVNFDVKKSAPIRRKRPEQDN